MKKLIILRGCSGAGKSTKAKELIKEAQGAGNNTIICSADQFFVDLKTGRYEFDARKLGNAHAFCRGKSEAAVEIGANLIIIDNTNSCKWEYEPYVNLAKNNDYECEEIMIGTLEESDLKVYANRNKHGVPLEAIQKMAKRFQL